MYYIMYQLGYMKKNPTWTCVRIRIALDDELEKFLSKYPHLGNKSTFVSSTLLKEMGL